MRQAWAVLAIITMMAAAGCGTTENTAPATEVIAVTATPDVQATVSTVQQTRKVIEPTPTRIVMEPTATSWPTLPPTPTLLPTPTATPVPTATAVPTTTPVPTPTLRPTIPLPPPEPTRAVPADMVKVPAPIESVEIIVAESFPPQYFVLVVSGLPNGCVEFHGYEESRSGNDITVTVNNLEPAPSEPVACTAIYLTHEFSVPLGTDFQPGETYTLKVNEAIKEFVAQ